MVDEIDLAEQTTHGLDFDHDTIRAFVLRLPTEDRKQVMEGYPGTSRGGPLEVGPHP